MTSPVLCFSCGSADLTTFYEVGGVPVHSCVLVSSREEALAFPRGDIRLDFCEDCGFIQNSLFDPTALDYFQPYEETQGFSPIFTDFARQLATALVARHQLRWKRILEIGCGKGEFLSLLCGLGPNYGLGIDPAYVPGREGGAAAGRVQFIRDLYSPRYAYLEGDLICCRHVLEHIRPVAEFLRPVADSAGRRDSVVFFEVPDVARVLREAAFWDVYHEHCSYFTEQSLARLFRAAGFHVLRSTADYDGQYLLLEARVDREVQEKPLELEYAADVRESAVSFQRRCNGGIAEWRQRLREASERGRRAVIWGGGSKAVAFLTSLGVHAEIGCVVDINPYKQGQFVPGTGQVVVAPEYLIDYRPDLIVVMNPVYLQEIRTRVGGLGLRAEVVSV